MTRPYPLPACNGGSCRQGHDICRTPDKCLIDNRGGNYYLHLDNIEEKPVAIPGWLVALCIGCFAGALAIVVML